MNKTKKINKKSITKKTKKINKIKTKSNENKSSMIMSIFILFIMVFSIIGFAFVSSGGNNSISNSNSENIPKNYPFQQIENQGKIFWYTIKNYKQFVFENISGYDDNIKLFNMSEKIKSQDSLEIYIDKNYNNLDSVFLIKRALEGLEIPYYESNNFNCNSNTLIFTYNNTLIMNNSNNNCIIFDYPKNISYKMADILTYNLVKN